MRKFTILFVLALALALSISTSYGQESADETLAQGKGCQFDNSYSEITIPSESSSPNRSETHLLQTIDSSVQVEQLCSRNPNWALANSEQALRRVYDHHRDDYLREDKAKLVSERDIRLNGRLGREIVLDFTDRRQQLIRTYLNGEYYVRVIVYIKDPEKADPASVKKAMAIIDSMRLL